MKIADPGRVARGWRTGLLVALGLLAVLWPLGLGKAVDQMRRQVAAVGYLKQAERLAVGPPVRRDAALYALTRAVTLAPDYPALTDAAAQLFVGLRAYQEALPWLRRQADKSLIARVSLGQSLLMVGQRAEGEALLQALLREAYHNRKAGRLPDPVYALLLNNVGYVHALAGLDLTSARNLIAAAVQLEPQQPAYIDSLGWAEYRLGNYNEAAFYLERAVRLYVPESSAEMYYHLGAAQARLGRTHEARIALERCLLLDPSMTEAADELENLNFNLPHPAVACLPGASPVSSVSP